MKLFKSENLENLDKKSWNQLFEHFELSRTQAAGPLMVQKANDFLKNLEKSDILWISERFCTHIPKIKIVKNTV